MTTPIRPTRPNTGSNCLKSCATAALVVFVAAVALILLFKDSIVENPMVKTAMVAAECQGNLSNPANEQNISAALDRYVTRNGRYPETLEELYLTYLKNRNVLHCPADPRPKNIVSYKYTPPEVDAPGSTVVIECDRHKIVEGQPPLVLHLLKDGRVDRPMPETRPPTPKQDAGKPEPGR